MQDVELKLNEINRRQALKTAGSGIAYMALNSLLKAETKELKPHHQPKAKRVIYLFQSGG